jgi:hypothetical protein
MKEEIKQQCTICGKECEPEVIKVYLKTEFEMVHLDNVQRVALALSMAGYFVKIIRRDSIYTVLVYSQNTQ